MSELAHQVRTTSRMADAEARSVAAAMRKSLADVRPPLLQVDGIDLAPAFEQVLFLTLRAGDLLPRGRRWARASALRVPAAVAGAVRPGVRVQAADVLLLALARVHQKLFDPVAVELVRSNPGTRIAQVTAGRAAQDPELASLPRTARHFPGDTLHSLVRTSLRADFGHATDEWSALVGPDRARFLRSVTRDTILRLAVEAARLDGTISVARPRAVVVYDEIDAWGRLLVPIAHRHGAAVVGLPHAEAVDDAAIRGIGYDLLGVYGPRAADVLKAAGVPVERVHVVGPARFDSLVQAARHEMERPARVVLAAQYRGARMTDAVRRGILEVALAAAKAIRPSVLQIVPHPIERGMDWEPLVAAVHPVDGVEISVEHEAELHGVLPGAALMATGWSNSVYESVLGGVPAITIHLLPGDPPMPFAAEGIAVEARTPAEAAQWARELTTGVTRAAALARARSALLAHLGPLDGGATARTADLVSRAMGGRPRSLIPHV